MYTTKSLINLTILLTTMKKISRILTNQEIYIILKKLTITETIRLHRLSWFGHVQRMVENRIFKRVFI
jgi:hypothetical protein